MGVIEDMVQYFRPDNCIMMLKDKAFTGKTSSIEAQYGTHYNIRPLTATELETWNNRLTNYRGDDSLASLLSLPIPNPFVATNFDLKFKTTGEVAEGNDSSAADSAFVGPDQLLRIDCMELPKSSIENTLSAGAVDEAAADNDGMQGSEEADDDEGSDEEVDVEDGSYEPIPQPSKSLTVWFKQDSHWKIPKLNVIVSLETLESCNSALSVASTDLLAQCLKEVLSEYSYYADCAGLHYDVSLAKGGLELSFSGYNDRLAELVFRTADELHKMGTSNSPCTADIYNRVRQILLRRYKNSKYSQPYNIAMIGALCCMEDLRWSDIEKYNALLMSNMDGFHQFVSRFTRSLRIEMLIHGNATSDEAKSLAETFKARLGCAALPLSQLPVRRVVDIKAGTDYVFGQKGRNFNPRESNSAIENVYVVGEIASASGGTESSANTDKLRHEALVTFVAHILSEQAFDQLRTKEQLGYIVHTAVKKISNIVALHMIVQSSHKDPEYLDRRIEGFLKQFYDTNLPAFTQEVLETNINAVVDLLTEKPKNLNEECNKYFHEVKSATYLFTRKQALAKIIATFTTADVQQFMETYLLPNANRKKFCAQLLSAPAEIAAKEDADSGDDAAGKEATKDVVQTVSIRDPALFKRAMPLLPIEQCDCVSIFNTLM
jgi:insulysin